MQIKFYFESKNVVAATTTGLVKTINEDRIGVRVFAGLIKACICDGHWGKNAAEIALTKCLRSQWFPNSKSEAIRLVTEIEKEITRKFGKGGMNENKDFTPETSLLAVEIKKNNWLRVLSYGDCRLIVTRNKKIIYKNTTLKTWLGAFSFFSLRNRIPIKKAIIFKAIRCRTDDLIWLFTDGVDECHYEHPTISQKWLTEVGFSSKKPKLIISKVFDRVERFGAEDNASIAIVKC